MIETEYKIRAGNLVFELNPTRWYIRFKFKLTSDLIIPLKDAKHVTDLFQLTEDDLTFIILKYGAN